MQYERRVVLTKCLEISNNTSRTSRTDVAKARPAGLADPVRAEAWLRRRLSSRTSPGLDPLEAGMSDSPSATVSPAEKVKQFPTGPGIYLMKDAPGRVIYVGKAKNLRSRASSYFHKTASGDRRICDWIGEVADIEFLAADSEVDALLMEARLVKDIQPKYNRDLKDDKSFPYLQITTGEDFPRVNFTRQPLDQGRQALRPVPACQEPARGDPGAPADLQVPDVFAGHRGRRPALEVVSPLPARVDQSVYGPVQPANRSRELPRDIRRLQLFLDGKKDVLLKEMEEEMRESSKALQFEKAARLRDEIKALGSLNLRGNLADHAQPEVFYVDPRKGLKGLKQILKLDSIPRTIDGVDIAHLGGNEMVGSLVSFVDGLPFKPGYRRYQIKSVAGIDDFAAIREVVTRRIKGLQERDEPFPDIWLIDGGKGQLSSALAAFESLKVVPPTVIALAKREEEIYVQGRSEPIVLSRRSFALRLLAIRPRRGPPLRAALSSFAS